MLGGRSKLNQENVEDQVDKINAALNGLVSQLLV